MSDADAESRLRAHMPLVEREAQRMSSVRRDWRDDLRSAGTVALWKACQSFDESRGANFTAFAAFAVRHAMVDEMRRLMPVSRQVVEWRKRRLRAETSLMQKLMRTPTNEEIEAVMREGQARCEQVGAALKRQLSVLSLESPVAARDGHPLTVADIVADDGPLPGDRVSERDYAGELAVFMEKMKPRDRLIFGMRFWDGVKMADIGRRVGITGTRVGQIIHKHCRQIGKKLKSSA